MGNTSYTVAVHSDETIESMESNCLQDLGGIEKLVPPGSRILLKPNMVVAKPNSTGATTNSLILDTLIEHLIRTFPCEIIIGESSEVGDDTLQAYKITGVYDIAKKWKVTLLDFKKDHQVYIDVPNGKVLKKVLIAETVTVEHLLLAAQAHLGPADLEEIKIISPKKLKEVQSDRVNSKEFPFYLPGLKVIEKGTCSSCKGALLAAMRRLHKERQSPHCTILMGQRLRDRECEFVPTFKYGTVKSKKPLVSIGQCCSWVVNNYPSKRIKGCPVKAEAIYRYI